MKKKILYISTNDGSDTRINKEVNSLVKKSDVLFLGVGKKSANNFIEKKCHKFHLVNEKRNSLPAIVKQIKKYLEWQRKYDINSIHIINEQLMIFFYPLLFKKYVVLDIFDSWFLKKNFPGNKLKLIKKLVYAPVNYIFVTDQNRKRLMPDFLHKRLGVLENYPFQYKRDINKTSSNLTIFYNGSMTVSRGSNLLRELVKADESISIIMAGWIGDEETKQLSKMSQVDFRGIITQQETAQISANESDYIMCCYEPNNQNNINASPNKIYDAIQTHTPVIINREVKVSSFVSNLNIGIVVDSFYVSDYKKLLKRLKNQKDKFIFSKQDSITYSWEAIESRLLDSHLL